MKAIEFKEQTVIIAKDQPEYKPLPAHQVCDNEGTLIFCWELSFKERIKLLFTGKLWHRVMTFHKHLQPQILEVNNPFIKTK